MCDTKSCCVTICDSDIGYHTNLNPKIKIRKKNKKLLSLSFVILIYSLFKQLSS